MSRRDRRLFWFCVALCAVLYVHFAHDADAMTVAVQDQGADTAQLADVASDLGAGTVRIIAAPGRPHTDLVRAYRASGLRVQAAILLKPSNTPGDVRGLLRAWDGQVQTVSIGNEPELNGFAARPCTYMRLVARSAALIHREFPGVKVGWGEFSPALPFEYLRELGACRIRPHVAFTAVHPYQFFSDPLAPPTELSGIGTWLGLGNLGRYKRLLRRLHLPARVWCTEFSYLVTGDYAIPRARATALWPRAVTQARKHCSQLVVYGLGMVPDSSRWGSAALLDDQGEPTAALAALARALGRPVPTMRVNGPLVASGPPADDDERQELPVEDVAHGASSDMPPEAEDTPTPAVDPEPTPAPSGAPDDVVPTVPADPPVEATPTTDAEAPADDSGT